jgi:AcrR family transcriptional regulator
MSGPPVNPRRYTSPLREAQARETSGRVVAATRALVVERGYAGVTMADIAAAAGVSVPLLYKVFGPKPDLVKRVYDVTLAGDDEPVPMAQRPAVAAIAADPDPRSKVAGYARMGRELAERTGPLATALRVAARAGEVELRAFLETTDAERLTGATRFVEHLAAAGALRPGLSVTHARDVVWLMISPEIHALLVTDRGWSHDEYEAWLAAALAAALLPGP